MNGRFTIEIDLYVGSVYFPHLMIMHVPINLVPVCMLSSWCGLPA